LHILEKVKRHGISGSIRKAANAIGNISGFTRWRFRKEPFYVDPTPDELMDIECDLKNMGVIVQDYYISPSEFNKFQEEQWFPSDYHGGINGPVWYEKLLEHFIASKLLGLMSYGNEDVFIDVAAGGSPWCHMLRLRKAIKAFAIDLSEYYEPYKSLPYYLVQNATCTTFADSSVKGMALHCAFEMFMRDDDIAFIREASRILLPKGKIIIVPLYMHRCCQQFSVNFSKGFNLNGFSYYCFMLHSYISPPLCYQ